MPFLHPKALKAQTVSGGEIISYDFITNLLPSVKLKGVEMTRQLAEHSDSHNDSNINTANFAEVLKNTRC